MPRRSTQPAKEAARESAGRDARYSIRIASRLTGVSPATLRMWERRYGFPRPERTTGGSRLYSESEVEALRLLRRALEHGYRPNEVVGKSSPELRQLVTVASDAPVVLPQGAPT